MTKGREGVVLLLDEAQLIRDERDRHGEHPLSLLIAPLVALQRQQVPLAVVLCGLPAVAAEVVDEVEGYPYFIQMWGSELWDAADLADVDRFTPELLAEARSLIYERLDQDFYEPRISILTPAEQDVLLASAACPYPPLRSSDLGRASDKAPGNVNVLLGRLVEAGVLYRIRQGEYGYTAPKFRDFLLRRLST